MATRIRPLQLQHEYDLCNCGHHLLVHQPEHGCWAEDCECPEFDDAADPTPQTDSDL